jgi:predicted MPP superfamily phosphohydrolase
MRYSNAEAPTLPLHETVLASGGHVWWGWWKKDTEPFPLELLQYIGATATANDPLRVGLVNRKDGEYYAADCIGLAFQDTGLADSCPEPTLCPDYYRADPLPAWFKFNRFDRLNSERFSLEFGAAPQLDPTLYDVVRVGSEFTIRPKPAWTMEPVETKGSRILHLTDLHFGEYHGYAETDSGGAAGQRSLATILREDLSRLGGPPIGVVVVSGDLVCKGQANDYSPAKDFLDAIIEVLGLSREHVVLVPGNHDIWLKDVENPTRDYSHEKPYREFLEAFYRRDIQDLEWIQRFSADGWDLTFLTLNSSRLRTNATKEYGYVGLHRYETMLKFVGDTLGHVPQQAQRQLVTGVVHHHLLPVPLVSVQEPLRPVSLTLDAGEILQRFQDAGVRLAIHGHQHVPFVSTSARMSGKRNGNDWAARPHVCVVGGGSAGVAMAHLHPEAPYNTFGLYDPKEDGVAISVRRYVANSAPEPVIETVVPL